VGGNGGFGLGNTTLLSQTGYVYALDYQMAYQPQQVFYASNDCSGTAFSTSPLQYSGNDALGGHFGVYVDGLGWYQSVVGSYQENRTIGSYRYSNSGCGATGGSINGYTLQATTAATIGVPSGKPALPVTVGEPAELIP
jgi:hypothetical protein